MVLETSISWPWFHFGIFSSLGNCKHNMWQASHLQHSRHRNRPSDCPWGTEKADGRWVGPHHSEGQWSQDEGSTWQIWFSPLRRLQESQEGQRGYAEMLQRVLSKYSQSYCVHILFFCSFKTIFFSLLCALATLFQLFDQLAKRTLNKNFFDIDCKLNLLLKNSPKRQICSSNAFNPQLNQKYCVFLNLTEQNQCTMHFSFLLNLTKTWIPIDPILRQLNTNHSLGREGM